MLKIKNSALVFFLLSIVNIAAQNNTQAQQILTDLLNSAKTNAIKTDFKLSISELKSSGAEASTGTFTLKGTKFVLEMDEMKVWFDGKTQWSYVPQNNEVSITEPTDKELAETNPMAILSGYKSKCVVRFSKLKSAQNFNIEMIPKGKNLDISKIIVQVNKTTRNLYSIKLTNKNRGTSLLTLTNFQKELKVSDNTFIFNANKFKGVVENDLR